MIYDSIIIGGGPAGLTAAIYALRANKKVLILEQETIGGKMASAPLIENYPGLSGITGSQLANKMFEQVNNLGGKFEFEKVVKIIPNEIKEVITEENTYKTKTIIAAVGSKYRTLGIQDEEQYMGNGISFCTVCDGAFYKDKIVAVIGGGNSAVINAISLSDQCSKVYIIQNLDKLTAEQALIDDLKKKNNIEILYNKTIKKIVGETELTGVIFDDELLELDGIFISIGQIPETDCFEGVLTLDKLKYVASDESCKTNVEGIFVAGDCREKEFRQITTALNDGTICALQVVEYLRERE